MSITDSIKLVTTEFSPMCSRLSIGAAKDIMQCRYRVTLSCGNYIDIGILDGIKMIEEFFKHGSISPSDASAFSHDINRVLNNGKKPHHIMPRINEFLAICQSHIDLMRKDERADDVADGTTTANEARDAVGLDPIKYNFTESPTAKIVKIDDVPLEASKTTFRLPSTMFTCVVGGEKQSYVVINGK